MGTTLFDGNPKHDGRDHSAYPLPHVKYDATRGAQELADISAEGSASRDCGGLPAVPSLTSQRTAAAAGNYDRAKTQRLFWGTRFWRWCARCSERSRQGEALSRLDDGELADIGVTRQQANAEVAKPFWK
jgi:uncharacterized protein YjiS (DUF1127 family)